MHIFSANSNSTSNLVLKDHSGCDIFPVSVKPAIPMSVSNLRFLHFFNPSDAMAQKPSFDSYSFKSSSFTNSASQQIRLFVTQNSQTLRFLLLLHHPPQFLQQIAIIVLIRFLQSLNLMIQNLLVCLLKHLIFCYFL